MVRIEFKEWYMILVLLILLYNVLVEKINYVFFFLDISFLKLVIICYLVVFFKVRVVCDK